MFPGQYRDEESDLRYNYFRYYDLTLSRYINSDPIGLNGGLNTYIYALNNPLKWIDFLGLDTAPGSPNPLRELPVKVPKKEIACFVVNKPRDINEEQHKKCQARYREEHRLLRDACRKEYHNCNISSGFPKCLQPIEDECKSEREELADRERKEHEDIDRNFPYSPFFSNICDALP